MLFWLIFWPIRPSTALSPAPTTTRRKCVEVTGAETIVYGAEGLLFFVAEET